MGFREKLREARTAKGINQVELSTRIGLSKNAVSNYENGSSNPNVDVLYRICKELNVDPNFLFQDEVPIHSISLNNDEKRMLRGFRMLNQAGQEELKKYIKLLLCNKEYQKTVDYSFNSTDEIAAYDVDDTPMDDWQPPFSETTAD